MDGFWEFYNLNGNIKCKIKFEGNDFHICEYYNENGESLINNGTGTFNFNLVESVQEIMENYIEGAIEDSLKVKDWNIYYGKGIIATDTYKKNKYKSSKYYTHNALALRGFVGLYSEVKQSKMKAINNTLFIPNRLFKAEKWEFNKNVSTIDYSVFNFLPDWESINANGLIEDEVVFIIDSMPQYVGGLKQIRIHVLENLRYPIEAQLNGIKEKVYMEVYINEEGRVYAAKPISKNHEVLVKEAQRVLMSLYDFKPGYLNNEPIKTKFVFPISFIKRFITLGHKACGFSWFSDNFSYL